MTQDYEEQPDDHQDEPLDGDVDFTDEERFESHYKIGKAFSPAAPVNNRDLFAGRISQMNELLSLAGQQGAHAIVYGERGVGKTSLAAVMTEIFLAGNGIAAKANCDTGDDYGSVWRKVLDDVQYIEQRPGAGFSPQLKEVVRSASDALPEEAGPGDVRNILSDLAKIKAPVIFLDEFDRIGDSRTRAMFADTIKMLSDQLVPATIVLVGVADTVDELIAEHESVERALVQIQMPRMSRSELEEIVRRGLGSASMEITDSALARITGLSQGLPHYTHLLGQHAGQAAIGDGSPLVEDQHVDQAVSAAIERAQRSIVNAYHLATASPRASLHEEVLLASALAQGDELGYFAPTDVREPLTAIMGKPYEIPSFVQHLHAFAEGDRGAVLQKRGVPRRFRFRFKNPLLQPFVIMHGLNEGLIDQATFERFS